VVVMGWYYFQTVAATTAKVDQAFSSHWASGWNYTFQLCQHLKTEWFDDQIEFHRHEIQTGQTKSRQGTS